MFISTTPPTNRLSPASAPSNRERVREVPLAHVADDRGRDDPEIVFLGRRDMVPVVHQSPDGFGLLRHQGRVLADDADSAHVIHVHNPPHGGGDGHDDAVVEVGHAAHTAGPLVL